MVRSLTETPQELRERMVEVINSESNDYNRVLNGNFVGLYCLNTWFDVKTNSRNELENFELTRLRTQFLIKIKKILARLRYPNFIVMNALYFLDLVKEYMESDEGDKYPIFYKTKEDNLFLNFVVCLMVSNKSSNDFAMKAKYWSRLTKIPIRKINELELVLLNDILHHHPLALNFNLAKLERFNSHLQAKIAPFHAYIEDFNAKFNSTYNKTESAAAPTMPTPEASPKQAYRESPQSTSSTSPYSETQLDSSCSPTNSSLYSVSNSSQIKIQNIEGAVGSLEQYIQTPTTNYKKPEVGYYASLPNPYNYVDFTKKKDQPQMPAYRETHYSLDTQA